MKIRFICFWVFCFIAFRAFAQSFPEKGMPQIENFTPQHYLKKGKVWDIASAPNGIVYMAADKGLLEYDGKTWNAFKGSNGFTRSLLVLNDSLIYTGSDLDFGVWKKNKNQTFEYTSLYPFQEDINEVNEEFWHVKSYKDNILFISFHNIYLYKNQQLTKIPAPNKFSGSFSANDSVYFVDEKEGLFVLSNLALKQILQYIPNNSIEIKGLYNSNTNFILVTKDKGLYTYTNGSLTPINNPLSRQLSAAKVFCFKQINGKHLAFGTVLKGLFITDLDGNIIHHINKKKGLPNNTILSLHYSSRGKLWLGLDQGISAIDLKSNFTFIYDYMGDFGTGYTACLKDNMFYLGTNQGLYQSKWEDLNNNTEFYKFQLIPGSEGQVWALKEIDNTLFIGHDRGWFTLQGNSLQKLSNEPGFWTITPYQKDYLLTGNYNGISIFKKNINNWTFLKKMELILGSCNQLIIENDSILWVSIPNFGLIRAVLDENLFPAERQIFPIATFEGENAFLSKNDEGIILTTDKFQYRYNETKNRFEENNNYAYYSNTDAMLSNTQGSISINSDYAFYSIYNGFAFKYLSNKEDSTNANFELVFRKLEAFDNETKLNFALDSVIPAHLNNLKIEWIVPNQGDVLYQFKTHQTQDWTTLKASNFLELLNLKPGKHTVLARASINGQLTEISEITFQIAAPWYRSKFAFVFYFAVFLFILFCFYRWQKLLLKRQQKSLLIKKEFALMEQAEQHNREVLALEQEVLKSEYDKLKQQLKSKTIELANKAKDNDEKKNLLLTIKEKFEQLQNDSTQAKPRLGEIKRLLDTHLNVEDHTFEIQIDELHQEFFKKLKDKFPQLSIHDLRLCAYLKIGMNSKEIAEVMNIQPSSAFVSRSRLRKKLNLRVDEDINSFLNAIN